MSPNSGELLDGPAVITLQKWDPLHFQVKLSDFCEASISPTRKLLLLLSHHCEVLLIPLLSGKESSHIPLNWDDSGRFNPEGCRETTSLPLCSQAQTDTCRTDLLGDVPCTTTSAEITSNTPSPSYCYRTISDVKSLAWGHFGDAYTQIEESGFKEILIVSGDSDIIVHAFRHSSKQTQKLDLSPDGGSVCGKWVEWGPSHTLQLNEEILSNLDSYEHLQCMDDRSGTSEKMNTKEDFIDANSLCNSLIPKKWLQTFLTELDVSSYGSKYMSRFPKKSSFPHSAEVVSFSIYDATLRFLDFFASNNNVSDKKENQVFETMAGLKGEVSMLESAGKISSPKQRFSCKEDAGNTPYKCSRVFSSTSYRYIGLVLASTKSCEGSLRNTNKIQVVVIMLHQWGMEWLCSVDLQNLYPGPGPGPEWTDFQFLENFLVSLSTSGLICLWGARHGELVAHVDVLHSCGLNSRIHYQLDPLTDVMKEDSASTVASSEENIGESNIFGGRETYSRDNIYIGTFRRLMVASESLLLACIDEFGVIYVICPDDYILRDSYAFDKLTPSSQHSNIGTFSGWKVAGCEIGSQKEFFEFSHGEGVNVSKIPKGGSSNIIQVKGWQYTHSNTSSTPIRRIFLPLNGYRKEDSICFSPFGITRVIRCCDSENKTCAVVHTCLRVASSVLDERDLFTCSHSTQETTFVGESIGCSFRGCLYLVMKDGISVILPSVSVSSSLLQVEFIKYWQPNIARSKNQIHNLLEIKEFKGQWRPWQIEILDRVLLYEGPKEAEHICSENGWDLKIAGVRRLQLALHYLKSDEIEKSLDMLVDVNLAEEGILRLLFTCVYEIFCKVGSENEVALASRLLALAACFATKMIRRYGLVEDKKGKFVFSDKKDIRISYLQPTFPRHNVVEVSNSSRLCEMAHFLEVIRNLQSRIAAKNKRVLDGSDAAVAVDTAAMHDDSLLPIVTMDTISSLPQDALELQDTGESDFSGPDSTSALPSIESSANALSLHGDSCDETDVARRRELLSLEKSRDMIARWGIDKLDLRMIVKDALHSGRLPLAVLQLHIQRQIEIDSEEVSHDTFDEIRDIGRTIAYDLFLKGESGLAVEILQRLGEDIELILRQLLLGTVSRLLREIIAQEMRKHGYLRTQELKMLERIYLIERLYPSSSFWETFFGRQKKFFEIPSKSTLPKTSSLKMILHTCDNLTIECGEIDGVVIGSWANVDSGSSSSPVCEDDIDAGYWACAAVWSDAWDHRTMDRIVLDQHFHLGIHVPWESQFQYHTSHSDLVEIRKLLDVIPTSLLAERTLKVSLKGPNSATNMGNNVKSFDHTLYICAAEELEPVYISVPNIKIFWSSAAFICSSWLKTHMEEELAKNFIFIQEYWGSTAEIMPLLARAGLLIDISELFIKDIPSKSFTELNIPNSTEEYNEETVQGLHILVVHYCTQYNLPSLLDLYLDHHNLASDEDSLSLLLEAAGDCHWAKWLLLSRIKGFEYEASLSNARSNLSRQMILGSNLSVLEIDEIVCTVDDMAEGAGEMAALATIMYAAVPMQKCIFTGSVNRNCSSSSQCTLENLRPGLQNFPTLWRTLAAVSCGHDLSGCLVSSYTVNVHGKSPHSDYWSWRTSIFSSAGGDTSLIQMLPYWFSKHIRRLVKLFIQGPLGWQMLSTEVPGGDSSLHRDNNYIFNINRYTGFNVVSLEASIQKSIEEELYSSLEENGSGVEQHLRRGRALAAFNHLLGLRAQKLKSMSENQELTGQTNAQSDVQMLLAPLSPSEGSLLSTVIPLAITHFEDSVLVASCALLLELCGLSAVILRVDITVLRRISTYYYSIKDNSSIELVSPKASFHVVDLVASLARALADAYIHHDHLKVLDQNFPSKISTGRQPPHSLVTVLQHLEKASLPVMENGKTCGSWLSSGAGDGSEFRSQQKDASQHWKLVTAFCQMHHLPLSTKYLAVLASDNDWVGFLTEAQLGGYPIDILIQVAAKEFSDPRLKTHILTVLKSMQSTKKKSSSSTNTSSGKINELPFADEGNRIASVELFGLLAECEKQQNPGEALLSKAKDLRWPLLAIIASCFSDVSPLSCLTVWLEITASRETSSIKVNDIYAKLAVSVGSAVDATNRISSGSRTITFRYNRKNPKRRRLMDPSSGNTSLDSSFNFVNVASSTIVSIAQEIANEDEGTRMFTEQAKLPGDSEEGLAMLSNMVAVLCEQHLFLPLLRAFEMFMPSCSLLPFIRSLQAFYQMRLSESSAHLASFSSRIKEEPFHLHLNTLKDGHVKTAWISSTAVKAADAMLSTCPSAYEKRCLLHLLAAVDFGDGGSASTYFRRLYWKINLAEPALRRDDDLYLGNETLDDASLLTALGKHGQWEQARNWARQLESSSASWKPSVHHVTEKQAEAMVAEWKEFLWDIPEERAALWNHCQTLFVRHSFPALQAGLFFLKHAEEIEKEISARELHEMLLLSLQWLSGTITQCNPVYPLHLIREIETRVWLLAVESEAQSKAEGDFTALTSDPNHVNSASIIEQTANVITKMDNHINTMRVRTAEKNGTREENLTQFRNSQIPDSNSLAATTSSSRSKRRAKSHMPSRRPIIESVDSCNDLDDYPNSPNNVKSNSESSRTSLLQEENAKLEVSVSGWEEKVEPADLERAVLSLLEFGQIVAAKQLQQKLSPTHVPSELVIVDAALKLADLSSLCSNGQASESVLDSEVLSVIRSSSIPSTNHMIDTLQALESLATICSEGCGRGVCRRIIAVVKAAKVLGLQFSEAFEKRPTELLQLLSLKAQDSFEEAKFLVQTHIMPPASIARILAESFLKGLLAAHRGGYMDFQKEEGPAPLLWRLSDFLKWAELCPSESEIGHALMRLVMTGQDIPHACEVELLILSHHFYKSSACLDGVDVLVTLAANRVESYVLEGDFSCLARLVTGVSNFRALNFILNILIENGQLELLLQKYSTAETATGTTESVRGFRMAVLTSLKLFNPLDLDAFAMVYNHFDMKHETASLLESRSMQHIQQWHHLRDKDRQHEDLLEAMRHLIEAAEVHSTIDAGHKTHRACARAFLLSLQIRIPDLQWLDLSETNARRVLVEQSRFQEALIVAEAYNLNQASEWALVLWNQMLKPDLVEQFVAEFVAVLPLQPSMLLELARFYRAEVAARGDQSHFSVWLSPGGLPAEWVKHLGRSFRSLLKRTRDLRVRVQLATIATGFADVIDACVKVLDKVPDNAGPLILRRGHGGAYIPLM